MVLYALTLLLGRASHMVLYALTLFWRVNLHRSSIMILDNVRNNLHEIRTKPNALNIISHYFLHLSREFGCKWHLIVMTNMRYCDFCKKNYQNWDQRVPPTWYDDRCQVLRVLNIINVSSVSLSFFENINNVFEKTLHFCAIIFLYVLNMQHIMSLD